MLLLESHPGAKHHSRKKQSGPETMTGKVLLAFNATHLLLDSLHEQHHKAERHAPSTKAQLQHLEQAQHEDMVAQTISHGFCQLCPALCSD